MRLGTSTNLLFGRPGGSFAPLEQTMAQCKAAGFTNLDLNCYDWTLPGSPLLEPGWESWLEAVLMAQQQLGIVFDQCHAYFYPFLQPNIDEDFHRELQRRSLICCGRLGAKNVVLHPETDWEAPARSAERNRAYFGRLLESRETDGLRIAVENMCDWAIAPKRKFCAQPQELAEFVDSFKDARMGVCWDFEHADIMEQNQPEALRLLGKRLYATHVSDTHSKTDNTLMHVLPLTGTVDWPACVQALREIQYDGVFCFEVHNYANKLPDAVVPTALRLAFEIGEHLMGL